MSVQEASMIAHAQEMQMIAEKHHRWRMKLAEACATPVEWCINGETTKPWDRETTILLED